jgi:NADH:ubiquinone oxidoreductase subunit 5 (subunit L)/multisubunit Na+/H+ antiporter MnhA subunit
MNYLLHFFVLLPLLGFLLSLLLNGKQEKAISYVSTATIGMHLLLGVPFVVYWLFSNHPNLNMKELVVYKSYEYEFLIDFYFDKISAAYYLVGAGLSFMVVIYSRYYLHREEGYKRFFNTILFFYLGYNITIFSGNFETLFVGWEMLGISSFLLIAFYRDRYLPVKNAIKVFSIYRLGDVGLILAMWMSHHLWFENISFDRLNNFVLVHYQLEHHTKVGIFISLMILIAAAAKSAQLPFSSWLPRAMEGPTPSSAIFYGSLSVHIGIFLLLRTYHFWEHQILVRIAIGFLGLTTCFIATGISRVQSSIKSQIAYASIAQIGIIFVEVAMGWHLLALYHFAGNAFLRTYQLLVSPSVVSYLIREQFYHYSPHAKSIEIYLPRKWQNTLYMLCIKEWNLDWLMYSILWNPIKKVARTFHFLDEGKAISFFIPTFLAGLVALVYKEEIPFSIRKYLPVLFALMAFVMVLKSFSERKNVFYTWLLIVFNNFWITLAITINSEFPLTQRLLYLSGVVVCGSLGFGILLRIKQIEPGIDLTRFHGHVYEYPGKAFFFLLACLGLTGFPITPTFIGEDLLFAHIHSHQIFLAALVALCFVVDGLSIIRVFARVFYGPHVKTYHEVAYKSS